MTVWINTTALSPSNVDNHLHFDGLSVEYADHSPINLYQTTHHKAQQQAPVDRRDMELAAHHAGATDRGPAMTPNRGSHPIFNAADDEAFRRLRKNADSPVTKIENSHAGQGFHHSENGQGKYIPVPTRYWVV